MPVAGRESPYAPRVSKTRYDKADYEISTRHHSYGMFAWANKAKGDDAQKQTPLDHLPYAIVALFGYKLDFLAHK